MSSISRLEQFGAIGTAGLLMPEYYFPAFQRFCKEIDFTNKQVLEIGGSSIPERFIFDILGVEHWCSVDILSHEAGVYQSKKNYDHYKNIGVLPICDFNNKICRRYEIFDQAFDKLPLCRSSQYDIIISINAFEHVLDLEAVLQQSYRLLRVGGVMLTQFGPIWSSVKGSHFWVNDNLNFMNQGPVPPWAHLLMDSEELLNYLLRAGVPSINAETIVNQHYISSFINRNFYEDYEVAFNSSDFSSVYMTGLWDWRCPKHIQRCLIALYGERNFNSIGISSVFYK